MPRGRSAASLHSDSSDVDVEGIDTELSKLQRQFRIMEGDRQAYSIESQELMRKQLAEIEALESEHSNFMKNLRLSESRVNRQRDQNNKESLLCMLEYKDDLEEQLGWERQGLRQLDQEIRCWERRLQEQRRETGGCQEGQQQQQQLQTLRTKRTLENRLDRALTRFSTQLVKNGQLREELETLRVERVRFEQLHRKLERELQATRKEIGAVIDVSTAAYESRVEAQSKAVLLKDKAEKDVAQHSSEMKELERVIDQDRKLKEFMGIKSQERALEEEAMEANKTQECEEHERRKRDLREDSMETYEAAFSQIRERTGEQDLGVLVSKFIEVEDKNFALFNYVSEQNNEIQRVQGDIDEILQEVALFRAQGLRLEGQHRAVLRDMELRQDETARQAQDYEQRGSEASKILDQLKTGVFSLFSKIDCDCTVIEETLGATTGIRDTNIMTYLGLVEQKTNKLLSVQSYLDSKDYDKQYDPREVARLLLGQNPELPIQSLFIQPPSTGEEYDTEESQPTDEEDRPLTQAELRERIMKGVLKKEEKLSRLDGGKEVKGSKTNVATTSKRRSQEA
ncbi:coiled-coil domain-containing protein 114 [Acipenser ruthenus]|uniref:coiled-coil domain-containing protein 114 n=1 Tax=Acipenser ruthenus TaxID=7906 RepID=UPI0027418D15|nr:coiled-coil domain-containing protein 114 [Acipenser ruthenus]